MTVFQGLVLGLVQGLAEFLPISSSAHLVIIPWILGWDDGGLTFDVALHAGTLVALLIYFRQEWINMLKSLLRAPAALKNPQMLKEDHSLRLTLYIVAATIPGAIIGLLLEKKAEHAFRDPKMIAINLAVVGVLLWWLDRRGKKSKVLNDFNLVQTLIIGFCQGLAVIPGVSRSGITISAALAEGYDRESAARFSFFLSMPIIAGACLLKLRHLTGADLTGPFMAGVLASAISGYFVIGALLRFLQRGSYGVFAVYRIFVGVAVWAIYLLGIRGT